MVAQASGDLRMAPWLAILLGVLGTLGTIIGTIGVIAAAKINSRQNRDVALINKDQVTTDSLMKGLAGELAAERQETRDLKQEIRDLRNEIREMERTFKGQIRELEKQIETQAREILAITAERDALKLLLQQADIDRGDQAGRIQELEVLLAERQATIDDLRSQLQSLAGAE